MNFQVVKTGCELLKTFRHRIILLTLFIIFFGIYSFAQVTDTDYQKALNVYHNLNATPMQKKLREERALLLSTVYWHPGDVSKETLIREFTRIKDLGFNSVRYHHCENPVEITDRWLDAAQEVGIGLSLHLNVKHYPGKPFDEVIGMNQHTFDSLHRYHPLRREAQKKYIAFMAKRYRDHPALTVYGGFGEPGPPDASSSDYLKREFVKWLEDKYKTAEAMDEAWNIYPAEGPFVKSFAEAPTKLKRNITMVVDTWPEATANKHRTYGSNRDYLDFISAHDAWHTQDLVNEIKKFDSEHPVIMGSHNLFINQPFIGWNFAKWGKLADMHFSSIHMAWHFPYHQGEVDRPLYIQSRMTTDYFKYGWTSAFETTGGAVQYSGGRGNHMDGGLMRRLMLGYIASGNFNISLWTFNHRPGGWEAGEYGLINYDGSLAPWTSDIKLVLQNIKEYREELWQAENQPMVGVLKLWDNEALHIMEPNKREFEEGRGFYNGTKSVPVRANIGISRALMNYNIPFEFVFERELIQGIAARYPVIYAPHIRGISDELLQVLSDYVEKGGILIADGSFAFEDPYGKMREVGDNSTTEQLFGAYINKLHDTRTTELQVNGIPLQGLYSDLEITKGDPLFRFQNGEVAGTTYRHGRGTAILLGFDAAMNCFDPGNAKMEKLVASLCQEGQFEATWQSSSPMTYRLVSPKADHYLIINDGPAATTMIKAFDHQYGKITNVLTGNEIPNNNNRFNPLVPERSAVWFRCEK